MEIILINEIRAIQKTAKLHICHFIIWMISLMVRGKLSLSLVLKIVLKVRSYSGVMWRCLKNTCGWAKLVGLWSWEARGVKVSMLVSDWVVRLGALAGDIAFCSWARRLRKNKDILPYGLGTGVLAIYLIGVKERAVFEPWKAQSSWARHSHSASLHQTLWQLIILREPFDVLECHPRQRTRRKSKDKW